MYNNFISGIQPFEDMYFLKEKTTGMYNNKVRLLQQESEWWKRQLSYLQAENTHLKNRLAEIANQEINKDLLAEAENFQHLFISEDQLIALTKKDVYDFDKWLSKEYLDDGSLLSEITSRQRKLRNEIEILEQKFNKLKFEFTNYVAENF
jgi:hypothetical protein